jgi:hypothetical protein
MAVRIALQSNQADALLIMDEDNAAPRLLSRPGEAIYNDASGNVEGNSPFQVAWLPEDERDAQLIKVRQHANTRGFARNDLVVFEGNAPANAAENEKLRGLVAHPAPPVGPVRIWLGAPNSIKGPTEVSLPRQSGSNLLVVGQHDEAATVILGLGLLALAAQHSPHSARFLVVDASAPGSAHRSFLDNVIAAAPQSCTRVSPADLDTAMADLDEELNQRADPRHAENAPAIYLLIHHLERFKPLRFEEEFSVGLDPETTRTPGAVLNRILNEGAHLGLHLLCTCDSYNTATRFLSRKALSEFTWRVLFQMSASDSASLIDDPRASNLGLHRAILYNLQEGTTETFRPYALPDTAWWSQSGRS